MCIRDSIITVRIPVAVVNKRETMAPDTRHRLRDYTTGKTIKHVMVEIPKPYQVYDLAAEQDPAGTHFHSTNDWGTEFNFLKDGGATNRRFDKEWRQEKESVCQAVGVRRQVVYKVLPENIDIYCPDKFNFATRYDPVEHQRDPVKDVLAKYPLRNTGRPMDWSTQPAGSIIGHFLTKK